MQQVESNIQPINIGGLSGRMLHLDAPSGKKRKILLIYGLHSSLERMMTTAQFHNQFGSVTMPDLPGFGGMDSFYKIDREPDLDAYADYLYAFMKSRNMTKDISIVAMSFGFLAITRMFQKYPESRSFAIHNISIVGFGRYSDFTMSKNARLMYLALSKTLKTKWGSRLVSTLVFNPIILRLMFAIFRTFNPKYKHTLGEQRKKAEKMELDLWQNNDARTKFYTYDLILTFDLSKMAPQLDMEIHNMYTKTDQYFSSKRVETSLKLIYQDYKPSVANVVVHAPSVLGSIEEINKMYSDEVKQLLS